MVCFEHGNLLRTEVSRSVTVFQNYFKANYLSIPIDSIIDSFPNEIVEAEKIADNTYSD